MLRNIYQRSRDKIVDEINRYHLGLEIKPLETDSTGISANPYNDQTPPSLHKPKKETWAPE